MYAVHEGGFAVGIERSDWNRFPNHLCRSQTQVSQLLDLFQRTTFVSHEQVCAEETKVSTTLEIRLREASQATIRLAQSLPIKESLQEAVVSPQTAFRLAEGNLQLTSCFNEMDDQTAGSMTIYVGNYEIFNARRNELVSQTHREELICLKLRLLDGAEGASECEVDDEQFVTMLLLLLQGEVQSDFSISSLAEYFNISRTPLPANESMDDGEDLNNEMEGINNYAPSYSFQPFADL